MRSYIYTTASYQEVGFIDEQSGFEIGILAGFGAGLNRFEIPLNGEKFNLIKGYNHQHDFAKLYNSVLLAPFPNRIKDGQYQFGEKKYQLPINQIKENNAIHGFLFNQSFQIEVLHTTKDKASLSLKHQYNGTYAGYPFPFNCWVDYVWKRKAGLTISTKILNTGNQAMPVGLGWHPYFQFPNKVDELTLQLNCKSQYKVDEYMIPTMQTVPSNHFQDEQLIGTTIFDDCFALAKNERIIAIVADEKNGIELKLTQATTSKEYPYLQIYTPKDRNSIALEPMTCIPNAFNNKKGLISLPQREMFEVEYELNVSN